MRGTRQMCRWGLAVVKVITLAAALAAAGASQAAGDIRHWVEIHDFAFGPAYLAAAPGDTVVWVNRDVVPHTITARDESWDSQAVPSNDAWELRVTEEMTGGYVCRYHPFMEGQVAVKHHELEHRAAWGAVRCRQPVRIPGGGSPCRAYGGPACDRSALAQ